MRYWIIIICLVGISACTSSEALPTLVEFPTPTVTVTASATIPTSTHTPTSTFTSSPTQTPSSTVSPTMTATSTSSFTPTATVTIEPPIIPTSERGLIGTEIDLFTTLIEIFDPPLQYQIVAEVDSRACAPGYCNSSRRYGVGDIIEVTGLVCHGTADKPLYRVHERGFFGGNAYIPPSTLQADFTVQFLEGDDPANNYSCSTLPTSIPSPIPQATTQTQQIQNSQTSTCGCFSGDTLNCSDFSSQLSAQSCLDQCLVAQNRDVHGLDPDVDGIACESLR